MSRSFDIYQLYAKEDGNGSYGVRAKYYQDYKPPVAEIKWNTGSGYSTNNAYLLTDRTWYSWNNVSGYAGCYYYGTGDPSQTNTSASLKISEMVGTDNVGHVATSRGPFTCDTKCGSISKLVTLTQYSRDVSSNDASMGGIRGADTSSGTWYSNALDGTTQYISHGGAKGLPGGYVYGTDSWDATPKSGYGFVKWQVDSSDVTSTSSSDAVHVAKASSSENIYRRLIIKSSSPQDYTAVAFFSPAYTVTFRANAPSGETASGSVADQSFTNGVAQNLRTNAYVVNGYEFTGWNTAADGTGTALADGADGSSLSSTPGGTVTLYAQWRAAAITVAVSPLPSGAPSQTTDLTPSISPAATSHGTWPEGTSVTVTAPASGDGVKFESWSVTGVSVVDTTTNPLTFTMPANAVTATANYGLKPIAVSFDVDSASAGATSGGITAYVDYGAGETGDIDDAVYGDKVVFIAPEASTGYSFDGWYSGSSRVSQDRKYEIQSLESDISIVAKYATTVVIEKDITAGDGSVYVNGSEIGASSTLAGQVLGSRISVEAAAGEGYRFIGWYIDSAASASEDLFRVAEIEVSAPHTYTAKFGSAQVVTITTSSEKNGDIDGTVGTLTVIAPPDDIPPPNANATGFEVYSFSEVQLVATPAAADALPLFRIVEIPSGGGDPVVLGTVSPVTVRIGTADRTFKALWGYPSTFNVSVEVPTDENMMGTAYIGAQGITSASAYQDSIVEVFALPFNGYKFAGWETLETQEWVPVENAKSQYAFVASENVSLRARFEQDAAALFLWEGSNEPKTMTWTSKVYTLPKPFDPVAARVDATGYPLTLTVGTYSSPSAVPERDHALAIARQDGRRLQRMRPERFLRVSVESTHEVDAVVVGTNMAEVN